MLFGFGLGKQLMHDIVHNITFFTLHCFYCHPSNRLFTKLLKDDILIFTNTVWHFGILAVWHYVHMESVSGLDEMNRGGRDLLPCF